MILRNRSIFLAYLLIASVVFIFSACEKNEDAEKATVDTTEVIGEPMLDSTAMTDEENIPDLTGIYTGKLGGHVTTLNITQQDSTSIQGKITIKTREEINQTIKGKFNFDDRSFSFSDQIQMRNEGRYTGTFSEDFKKLSGTFTQKVDNETASFTLTKK